MKDNKDAIFFFLLAVIVIGLAWGPVKDSNKISTGKANEVVLTDTTIEQNISAEQQLQDINRNVEQLRRNVQAETDKRTLSPYYGKVTTSGITSVNSDNPNEEYITLYTNLDSNEKVDITGWYFKSEITGNQAVIGKASILPYPFKGEETDVILKNGDTVYLTKGFSPIGISFRTNKCTGYFEENRNFTPPLPLQCPRPIDEPLPQFSSSLDQQDACLDAIKYTPSCSTRGSSYTRTLSDVVPTSCKKYIETKINYDTCVENHFSDVNFAGHEYRLYFKSFAHLWRDWGKKETIHLYDHAGLIVDTISY
jgi:hypothetical protein